jgi:hypothetical protein
LTLIVYQETTFRKALGGTFKFVAPDGFPTEAAAIEAAQAAIAPEPWKVWYHCDANGRTVMVPGLPLRVPSAIPQEAVKFLGPHNRL